jgi:diketogulonate reductase-like aldo/keto reductase
MTRKECLSVLSALGLLPACGSAMSQGTQPLQRTIPSSGERLTAVGLGTWQTFDVGESPSERNPRVEVLKTLVERGGSVVDSSPMYGRSESVLGQLAHDAGLTDKLFLATKVWTSGEQEGIRQMERSFTLLKTGLVHLMQVHNLVDWKTHLKTLRDWKERGRIKYIGITHYTEGAYGAIEDIIRNNEVDFLQINYSILRRKAEERLFPLAQERKVAVIVNQPFQQGALFSRVKSKTLPGWTDSFDCRTWGQFFLKFILAHPAVTCVIPGTSKPHHMADNIGAAYGRLPNADDRDRMIREMTG